MRSEVLGVHFNILNYSVKSTGLTGVWLLESVSVTSLLRNVILEISDRR